MSDKLNPNDQELSFKERILRDLELLKNQIEEVESASFEAQSQEQSETPDQAIEDQPQQKPNADLIAELTKKLEAQPEPTQFEEVVSVPEFPQVSEHAADMVPEDEVLAATVPEVPDFVAEQAKQIEASVPQFGDSRSVLKVPEQVQQTKKLDLTFKPTETADEDFLEIDKILPPIPKRAVDSISEELSRSPRETGQIRRSRSQATDKKSKSAAKKAPKKRSKARKIVAGIFTTLFLALVATAVAGYFYVRSSLGPMDSKSKDYVQVEIAKGSSVKDIAHTLEQAGLIRNATIFDLYVKFNNLTGFQSGYHQLQKSMDVADLIKALQKEGTAESQIPALGKITIPEGYTLKQISEAVAINADSGTGAKSPFTAEEFMALVNDEAFITAMQAKYPDLLSGLPTLEAGAIYRLEGYLFPATYEYRKETTLEELVEQMIAAMDANLRAYYATISEKGLTVNQVLTLASLVEKEGSTDEDRKKIASVFFNRIQWGMPLQSNIAVLYAEGKLGERITLAEDASIDTQIASPYNVYTNLGYMPGPVDSPSLSAIKATIEPDTTEYFYFVADVTTGQVYFANTLAEHDVNVQTYVNSKIQSSSNQ